MAVGPDRYKRALSRFPSGVTVVTVADQGEPHGMTASSFAAVSLDPPLILVCLDKTSRTREILLSIRRFAVNVLSGEQQEVARAFALRGVKPFDSLPHHAGTNGAPVLDGAIAWIECDVHSVVEAGDHDVILGDVTDCDAGEGAPLIYFARDYRNLDGPPTG